MFKILDKKFTVNGDINAVCDAMRKIHSEYSDFETYAIETWYNGKFLFVRVYRKL